jgi:hypothetical protein
MTRDTELDAFAELTEEKANNRKSNEIMALLGI